MPNAQGQASAPRPIKGHSRSGAQRSRAGPCPGRAAIPLWRPRAAPTAKGQVSAPLLVRAKLSRRPRAHRIRAGLLKGAAQDPGPAQSKGQTQRPALTAANHAPFGTRDPNFGTRDHAPSGKAETLPLLRLAAVSAGLCVWPLLCAGPGSCAAPFRRPALILWARGLRESLALTNSGAETCPFAVGATPARMPRSFLLSSFSSF